MRGCFSYSFDRRLKVIHQTKYMGKAVNCPFYHHPPMQNKLFNLIRSKYRQEFEKSLHNFRHIICKYKKQMQKSKFITSSQSTGYQVILKRCLVGLQKGVSNTLKEHLLQANQASFRSQKSMCQF